MPHNVDFLKAKIQAIKTVLDKTSPKERENRVPVHLAKGFNEILSEIGNHYPEAASHLPKPIPSATSGLLRGNGLTATAMQAADSPRAIEVGRAIRALSAPLPYAKHCCKKYGPKISDGCFEK